MLGRRCFRMLCYICFAAAMQGPGNAQELHPIVISDIVGDTIDCDEREMYMLFPGLSNFKRAVFVINPDSTLSAILTVTDGDVLRDTVIHMRRSVTSINNQIEALFEQKYGISRSDTLARQDIAYGGVKGGIFKVKFKDGHSVIGELMSVRPHTILVAPGIDGWEKTDNTPKMISTINRDSISDICIRMQGHNNLKFLYTAAGAFLGLSASLAVVKMNIIPIPVDDVGHERGEHLLNYIFILTVFGAIVGNVSANKIDEFDECKGYNTDECKRWLTQYARYRNGEPPYLKAMFP
jgi:hypothetical protein